MAQTDFRGVDKEPQTLLAPDRDELERRRLAEDFLSRAPDPARWLKETDHSCWISGAQALIAIIGEKLDDLFWEGGDDLWLRDFACRLGKALIERTPLPSPEDLNFLICHLRGSKIARRAEELLDTRRAENFPAATF